MAHSHRDPIEPGTDRPPRGGEPPSRAPSEAGRPAKRKRCAKPRIISDTAEHITFSLPAAEMADNEAIRFEKEGNGSWIETVKWAQRNGKTVCVRYHERDAEVFWIDDELFVVYPPSDVFEQP